MTRPIRIVPAILTDDPKELKSMLNQAETFTDYVQIDVMDGKFVPSRSITWEHLNGLRISSDWEVHLMVEQPEQHFARYRQAGTGKVIFHYEAAPDIGLVIAEAQKLGLKVGLAVNPETPVSSIVPFTDRLDSVLFLSVHPGYYGAKFIPAVLDKIRELRQARPDLKIGIDGGIKATNVAEIAATGVNDICVGSAVFLQPDPAASYRELLSMAQQAAHG